MRSLSKVASTAVVVALISSGAIAANLKSNELLEVKVTQPTADAEIERLWVRFGDWCGIAEWHPAVRSCSSGKEGGALYRTLALTDGAKIKEKLLGVELGTYRYSIVESPLPVKNYEAQFSIVPDKAHAGQVDIHWSATYDAADGKSDADAQKAIDGIFKGGLASIKSKIPTIPEPEEGGAKPAEK
jgi:hypothetical protein